MPHLWQIEWIKFRSCHEWRHVPTDANIIVLVSKGTDIHDIVISLWFKGPSFLMREKDQWAQTMALKTSENKKCMTVGTLADATQNCFVKLIHRQSNFARVVHMVADVVSFYFK